MGHEATSNPAPAPGSPAGLRKQVGLAVLCLAIAFGAVLGHGFVNWDDFRYVVENPLVTSTSGISWWERLTTATLGYPLPLPVGIYWVLWRISQDAAIFHAFNLIIHIFNAALFHDILRREIGRFPIVCYVCALGFALHPLVVEPVAWVTGLKDLLVLSGALVAIHGARHRASLMCLGLMIAFASKPSGALVVLPVLAANFVDSGRRRSAGERRIMQASLLLCGVVAGGLVWFTSTQESNALRTTLDRDPALREIVGAVGLHVQHVLVPSDLSPLYPRSAVGAVHIIVGAVVIALCGYFGWVWARRKDPRLVWWALGVGVYAPASNLVPLLRFTADSYVYCTWMGACAIAGHSWIRVPAMLRDRPIFAWRYGTVAAVLASWVALSHFQTRSWATSQTLWASAYELYSEDGEVVYLYGMALGEAGHARDEMALYLTHLDALATCDRIPAPLVWWYEKSGDLARAVQWLKLGLAKTAVQDNLFYWTYAEFVVRHPEISEIGDEWALARGIHVIALAPEKSRLEAKYLRRLSELAQHRGALADARTLRNAAEQRAISPSATASAGEHEGGGGTP